MRGSAGPNYLDACDRIIRDAVLYVALVHTDRGRDSIDLGAIERDEQIARAVRRERGRIERCRNAVGGRIREVVERRSRTARDLDDLRRLDCLVGDDEASYRR